MELPNDRLRLGSGLAATPAQFATQFATDFVSQDHAARYLGMRQAITRGTQNRRAGVGLAFAGLEFGTTQLFLFGFKGEKTDTGGVSRGIWALGNPATTLIVEHRFHRGLAFGDAIWAIVDAFQAGAWCCDGDAVAAAGRQDGRAADEEPAHDEDMAMSRKRTIGRHGCLGSWRFSQSALMGRSWRGQGGMVPLRFWRCRRAA